MIIPYKKINEVLSVFKERPAQRAGINRIITVATQIDKYYFDLNKN